MMQKECVREEDDRGMKGMKLWNDFEGYLQ
jgi:hypothetical protein